MRQLLFDLPDDMTVEVEVGISIFATTVSELYRAPWQGPIAFAIHHDPDPRFSVVRVERP
jgi:hypothetical protein